MALAVFRGAGTPSEGCFHFRVPSATGDQAVFVPVGVDCRPHLVAARAASPGAAIEPRRQSVAAGACATQRDSRIQRPSAFAETGRLIK